MGDLTKNFSRSEFRCKCGCDYDVIDFATVDALQKTADHFADKFDTPIWVDVTSGNRCRKHNDALREIAKSDPSISMPAENSLHIDARAADVKFFLKLPNGSRGEQIDPNEVADHVQATFPKLSVGRYHNRTHVDSRTDGPAYWSD